MNPPRPSTAHSFNEFVQHCMYAWTNGNGRTIWWRGQSRSDWKLVPAIFRTEKFKAERSMINRFKRLSQVRTNRVPTWDDHPAWLELMQHYGLPTRMLDWSESALVALFFAVENKEFDSFDGAVWGLRPAALNRTQLSLSGALNPRHPALKPIIDKIVDSAGEIDLFAGVSGCHADYRHLVQQAQYSLHGGSTPLEDVVTPEELLVKIDIPFQLKSDMRKVLHIMGINRASLFPDLANLAEHIAHMEFGA